MSVQPFRHRCPHCGDTAKNRSSRSVTPTVSDLYMVCDDFEGCGAVYGVQLQVTHMITESLNPNPRLKIPHRPSLRGSPAPANDDHAPSSAEAAQG